MAKAKIPAAMRSGRTSNAVRDLQVLLRDRGFYTGRIDGYYGNYTRVGVFQFQKSLGVRPSGHWDQATVDAVSGGNPDKVKVDSEASTSSDASSTTPPSPESEPGSQPTGSSAGSSKTDTKSGSSSSGESEATSTKASK